MSQVSKVRSDGRKIFLYGMVLILFGAHAAQAADEVSYIEDKNLVELPLHKNLEVKALIEEEYPNYSECPLKVKNIRLAGEREKEAIFLTTSAKCWGAWQGPIWILENSPEGEYSVLLHTVSYGMKFSEARHHGMNDIILNAGSASESHAEVWQFDGRKFQKMNTKYNDTFESQPNEQP